MKRARFFGIRGQILLLVLSLVLISNLAGFLLVNRATTAYVLSDAQNTAIDEAKSVVAKGWAALGDGRPARQPPTVEDLKTIISEANKVMIATYRDKSASTSFTSVSDTKDNLKAAQIPAELKSALDANPQTYFMRTTIDAAPVLVVGSAIVVQSNDGPIDTGIRVYAFKSLANEQASVNSLTQNTWWVVAIATVAAVLLGVLISRRIVRPLRRLDQAATELGAGNLDVRVTPSNSHDEVARLGATFNATAAKLQYQVAEIVKLESESRQFAADVSHELRTPLASMSYVSDIIASQGKKVTDPDLAEALGIVSAEIEHLSQLVENLLEISRLDAGTATVELDDCNLQEAIEASIRVTRSAEVTGSPGSIEFDIPSELLVRADRRRLTVVLSNLLRNADLHGIQPIRVVARPIEPNLVSISVKDSGPGISNADAQRIFLPFVKSDSSRQRLLNHSSPESSGLGLSIAVKNAESMGGRLVLENPGQNYAIFTLTLPEGPS